MKSVSNNYKTQIKTAGRQIKSEISYNINNTDYLLTDDDLYSVKPYFKGDILKSVMKQLDFNCKQNIPLNTIVNYKFGLLVNGQYEIIDFGNYVVYKTEKNEETQSYEITCYDKMLYSMKDYEQMNITYPITIRNYINAICEHLGLTFKNSSGTFANYNKQIPAELYLDSQGNSLGYTFRDVLDELAQVTASTICINEEDDELEVRYINNTGDTINGDYLKNVNVNFGELTKPINTIVLSRSGGSDKIYLSYPSDLPENERNSIEIADNQIMNFNDRDTYLPDILNKLNGLTYCLNDFSSTGITYYNLCDKYNVQIGENTYSCIMFNDEINVTQGLEENVYTELPKETETDYTKADKTDRKINQTYLIVDKQNQQIQSVVSSVTEQNSKISTITQKVDQIESEIQNVTGMTQTKEGLTGSITFTDETNASEPIMIKVYPIVDSITCLYPRSNLYPSSNLYSSNRKIRFRNTTTSQNIDYELPDDLLYYDSNTYDEFYLNLESQTCQVTKRCKYNADGTISALASERVDTYSYPLIELTEGTYTVSLLGYNNGYITTTLMAKNIYTDQFYTKVETDSKISQTAENITLSVDTTLSNYSTTDEMNTQISLTATEINNTVRTKVGENEIISKINQTPESITINANKLNLQGYITASDLSGDGTTTINGANITTGTISAARLDSTVITTSNFSAQTINASKIMSGTLDASKLTVKNLSASSITSGTLDASKVTVNNLNASKITGGTLNAEIVAITNLSASSITTGTISAASINLGNGKFSVNTSGYLNSTSGKIGGFTIGTSSLSASSSHGIGIYTDGRATFGNNYGWINTGSNGTWLQGNSYTYPCYVLDTYSKPSMDGRTSIRMHSNYGKIYIDSETTFGNTASLGGTSLTYSDCELASNNGSTRIYSKVNSYIMGVQNAILEGRQGSIVWSASVVNIGRASNTFSPLSTDSPSIYIGGSSSTVYIKGNVYGGSSKAIKDNIVELSNDELESIYNSYKKQKVYSFNYKKEYNDDYKRKRYGFMLDEMENQKIGDMIGISQDKNDKNIKTYNPEDLVRANFIMIKILQDKIETLEKEVQLWKKLENHLF